MHGLGLIVCGLAWPGYIFGNSWPEVFGSDLSLE